MKCLELQELFALDALGVLDRAGQSRLQALVAEDAENAGEAGKWRDAAAAFAAAVTPRRRPPAGLRERILTRIQQVPQRRHDSAAGTPAAPVAPIQSPPQIQPPRSPMSFDFAAAARWQQLPGLKGIRVRVLTVNAAQGYRVIQAELDPGARFPAHHHGTGPEDLFVLTGDLITEGRTLRAGDHFHAEPGTDHGELISPSGCQAIIVEPVTGPEFAMA